MTSMFGGGSNKTTTTTTMDPTLKPYVTYALDEAKGIYQKDMPKQTDPSKLIAQQGPYMQEYKAGASDINAGVGTLANAIGTTGFAAQGVANLPQYNAATFDPRTLDAETIAKYSNPYQRQVIDAALAGEQLRAGQEMAALRAQNARQKAVGGSRSAVAEALLSDQQLRRQSDLEANLLAQGYDKATALATAQQEAQFEADRATEASRQFAENSALARGEFGLKAGATLADQAAAERNMEIQRLQGLKDIGVMDQALEQRLLDLTEAQKQYEENYKKIQLSDLASIIYGAPAGSQTTQKGGGTSTGQALLGAALFGLGSL